MVSEKVRHLKVEEELEFLEGKLVRQLRVVSLAVFSREDCKWQLLWNTTFEVPVNEWNLFVLLSILLAGESKCIHKN